MSRRSSKEKQEDYEEFARIWDAINASKGALSERYMFKGRDSKRKLYQIWRKKHHPEGYLHEREKEEKRKKAAAAVSAGNGGASKSAKNNSSFLWGNSRGSENSNGNSEGESNASAASSASPEAGESGEKFIEAYGYLKNVDLDNLTLEDVDKVLLRMVVVNMYDVKWAKIAFEYLKAAMPKFQGSKGFDPKEYVAKFKDLMESAEKEGKITVMSEYKKEVKEG